MVNGPGRTGIVMCEYAIPRGAGRSSRTIVIGLFCVASGVSKAAARTAAGKRKASTLQTHSGRIRNICIRRRFAKKAAVPGVFRLCLEADRAQIRTQLEVAQRLPIRRPQ